MLVSPVDMPKSSERIKKIIHALRSTDTKMLAIKLAVCVFLTVLFMILWWPGVYICAGIVCFLILIEFDVKSIVYLFFFASFELVFDHAGFTAICVIYMIVCLVHFLKQPTQEKKKYIFLGAAIAVFLVYCALVSIGNMGSRYLLMIRGFILLFLCCVVKEKISLKQVVCFFIAGILIASLIGMFIDLIPELASRNTKYMAGNLTRFSALTFNPNRLSAHVCLAIPGLLILDLRKQISLKLFLPIFMVLLGIGFSTISRTFFIIFVASFTLYVGLKIWKERKTSIKPLVFIFSIILITGLCTAPFIVKGFDRLSDFDQGSDRITIWINNLQDWLSSPKTFFFGRGIDSENIDTIHQHNFFIFLLAKTGLIGFLLFSGLIFALLYTFIKFKGHKFCVTSLLLPLAFICLLMFELTIGSAKGIGSISGFLFLLLFIFAFEKKEVPSQRTQETVITAQV